MLLLLSKIHIASFHAFGWMKNNLKKNTQHNKLFINWHALKVCSIAIVVYQLVLMYTVAYGGCYTVDYKGKDTL